MAKTVTHEERLLAEIAKLKQHVVDMEHKLSLQSRQIRIMFNVLISKPFIFFLRMMKDSTQYPTPVFVSTPEYHDEKLYEMLKEFNVAFPAWNNGFIIAFREEHNTILSNLSVLYLDEDQIKSNDISNSLIASRWKKHN